jgi:hypothetical protein
VTARMIEISEDDARHLIWLTDGLGANKHVEIRDRLRAQLAPPRMDEPSDFGAMVEASLLGRIRLRFVRAPYHGTPGHDWVAEDSRSRSTWDALVDPRPIGGES